MARQDMVGAGLHDPPHRFRRASHAPPRRATPAASEFPAAPKTAKSPNALPDCRIDQGSARLINDLHRNSLAWRTGKFLAVIGKFYRLNREWNPRLRPYQGNNREPGPLRTAIIPRETPARY